MRKIALFVLLLAACGRRHPGVTIQITADGFVKVEGQAVTLDELATLLAARRDAAPLEKIPSSGFEASSLNVLLDLEDEALWRHVIWVMTVLAEQKLWKLTFPGGREVPLPSGHPCPGMEPDGEALLVRVRVLANGEYRVGNRTTRDAEEIGKWIEAAPRDGFLCRIGVIWVQPWAPWRCVRPVLDVLRSHGARRIDFDDAIDGHPKIPARDQRGLSPLPPVRPSSPTGGPPGPSDPDRSGGLFCVDYWSSSGLYEELDAAITGDPLRPWLDHHRRAIGALIDNDTLRKVATSHAEEMARMGYYGHFSPVPGNRSPSDRLAKAGWSKERRHAELIAKADTADVAFQEILKNPENVAILADPAFMHVGVGQAGDCWVVLLGVVG